MKHLKEEILYCQSGAMDVKKKHAKLKRVECHAYKCMGSKRKKQKKNDLQICLFIHDEEVFFPFLAAVLDLRQKNGRLLHSIQFCFFFVCSNAESTIYQMMFKPNTQERPSWYYGSGPMQDCMCMRIKEE